MKKYWSLILVVFLFSATGCTINLDDKKISDDSITPESVKKETEKDEKMENSGKESSKSHPLELGQVGIASKYNAVLDVYQDVDVKIVKVYDDVEKIIDEYNTSHPDDKIAFSDDEKIVILSGEMTLINFETESFGTDSNIDVEIATEDDENFVVNGVKQIVDVKTLKIDNGLLSGDTGTFIIAFKIPKDADGYLVKLGTNNHSIAYYKM